MESTQRGVAQGNSTLEHATILAPQPTYDVVAQQTWDNKEHAHTSLSRLDVPQCEQQPQRHVLWLGLGCMSSRVGASRDQIELANGPNSATRASAATEGRKRTRGLAGPRPSLPHRALPREFRARQRPAGAQSSPPTSFMQPPPTAAPSEASQRPPKGQLGV